VKRGRPTTHPAFIRFNVFLRDKFCCQFCGPRDDLTFDHSCRARAAG
jgi:5-methylcytosine-specific restriction endonuclease McrA